VSLDTSATTCHTIQSCFRRFPPPPPAMSKGQSISCGTPRQRRRHKSTHLQQRRHCLDDHRCCLEEEPSRGVSHDQVVLSLSAAIQMRSRDMMTHHDQPDGVPESAQERSAEINTPSHVQSRYAGGRGSLTACNACSALEGVLRAS
jgi:hypothetical protein